MTTLNHPWNQFDQADQGDEDINVLFAAVGKAISSWETMESHLGSIFADLCGPQNEAPFRAYGTVSSSRGRISMIREAYAVSTLSEFMDDDLSNLLGDVEKFAARRNDIAHGLVQHRVVHDKDRGHFWGPPTYNSKRQPSKAEHDMMMQREADDWHKGLQGSYSYNSAQIDHYTAEFSKLAERAFDIRMTFQRRHVERVIALEKFRNSEGPFNPPQPDRPTPSPTK